MGLRIPCSSCWDRANTAGCGVWGVLCYCCCALTGALAFSSVCSLSVSPEQLRTDGCDLFGRDTDAQQPLLSHHHHRDENSQTESNRLEEWDGLISIDSFLVDLNWRLGTITNIARNIQKKIRLMSQKYL